ncbi:MAG: polyphosphate kinase 1 [Bacteroidales bacterium]|nr:polyphosphate kinase 1 [Bacteroidales bacterium]
MATIYRPKEISWLSFSERVLQQALNEEVPLHERVKFLGIYSNNMDEFYRVRVATLKRLTKLKSKAKKIVGHSPVETLKEINRIVREQNKSYEEAHQLIKQELKKNNIEIVDENELSDRDYKYAKTFFCESLKGSLLPIILRGKKRSPDLVDDNIYFALKLIINNEEKPIFALMQLPTNKFDRFIILHKDEKVTRIMYLDDIVRLGLKELFYFLDVEKIKAYAFKLTKDAELDIKDDISSSYLELLDKSLKRRKKGLPVRLVYDRNIEQDILDYLVKMFKIGNMDTLISGTRYHNTKDFLKFPNVLGEEAIYKKIEPIKIKALEKRISYFDVVKKQDIFLHYPYHSFNYFVNFIKEAAIDKDVVSIKITLYRLSKNSDIISALLSAVQNGKYVTAVIELQARFDEKENISWSKKLTEGGVKVIHGVPGLKVHSKLTLITKKIGDNYERFAAVGTGNYNETTAKLYTDITILTANPKIILDVQKMFEFIKNNYKHFVFNHLLVSPFNFRTQIKKLIKQEIENAKAGEKAYIHIKINNFDDREIIDLLSEASQNGVEVILLIRGMFSLITGIKDKTDKIEAYGIIDRFLEHTRMLIFGNAQKPKIFLSSADLMVRNIDRRVEATFPIFDPNIQKIILDIFDIHKKDNVAARILDNNLSNKNNTQGKEKIRAQIAVYNYLQKIEKNTNTKKD